MDVSSEVKEEWAVEETEVEMEVAVDGESCSAAGEISVFLFVEASVEQVMDSTSIVRPSVSISSGSGVGIGRDGAFDPGTSFRWSRT